MPTGLGCCIPGCTAGPPCGFGIAGLPAAGSAGFAAWSGFAAPSAFPGLVTGFVPAPGFGMGLMTGFGSTTGLVPSAGIGLTGIGLTGMGLMPGLAPLPGIGCTGLG